MLVLISYYISSCLSNFTIGIRYGWYGRFSSSISLSCFAFLVIIIKCVHVVLTNM
ncbi:unnamed protein product [Schistosoma margrebowiei]|uniref:Uncharacterized protein n=1 Tax=Schistosoma margrebowiei TaxID=48269 RepID=A0A3P8DUZ3_9TREM|nr:unnamed protein product [Schistosoma margrebowiei]